MRGQISEKGGLAWFHMTPPRSFSSSSCTPVIICPLDFELSFYQNYFITCEVALQLSDEFVSQSLCHCFLPRSALRSAFLLCRSLGSFYVY